MEIRSTDDFISKIEAEPAIWDSTADEYSNKVEKRNAWERIVQKYVEDYNEKSPGDKRKLGAIAQRKWKSLRDSFTRELGYIKKKKIANVESCRKQYVYFKQLSFLLTDARKTAYNIEEESTENEGSFIEETQDIENIDHKEEFEEFDEEIDPLSSCKKRRRPKYNNKSTSLEKEDELLDILKQRMAVKLTMEPTEYDADTMFMLSLVPELKHIPENKKLDVKLELMSVLKRAKLQQRYTNNKISLPLNNK